MNLPLPHEKKLTVVFRVEAGCLGPDGQDHIDEFCNQGQKEMDQIDADFIIWVILPRHDKTKPEMEYKINNKNLTHDKAAKYLEFFKKDLDEFEEHLHDKLDFLIEEYKKA